MSIQTTTNRVCQEADFQRADALAALWEEVEANPELQQECVKKWCSHAISDAIRSRRADFWKNKGPVAGDKPFVVDPAQSRKMQREAFVKASVQDWYQMPMPDSDIKLGDATIEDLRAAYTVWDDQARHNANHAAWCERLIAGMKAGKNLRESWNLRKLDSVSQEFEIQEAAS